MLNQELIDLLKQNNDLKMFVKDGTDEYEIHSVFSLHDDDEAYFELYSDLLETKSVTTTTQILEKIKGRPLDTRVDIVVGNEDGNDVIAKELNVEFIVFK